MDSSGTGESTRLREEVRYLRRRLQYLQSVSTVFRQRISLLLREVAEDPAKVRELHAAYTTLLSETALAEKQDSFDPNFDGGANGSRSGSGVGFSSPSNNNNTNRTGSPFHQNDRSFTSPGRDPVKAREDVRRAHHLCMILQERNELKKRELELEHVNRELMNRLSDAEKNNGVPKGSYTSSAVARQQQTRNILNNNSITSFMDRPNTTTTKKQQRFADPEDRSFQHEDDDDDDGELEVEEMHNNNNNNDTSSVASTSALSTGAGMLRSIGGGDHSLPPNAAFSAVQRQNAFLKGRVQRLKQELDDSLKQRTTSIDELQKSLDNLAFQVQNLKTENTRRQREVAESNRAKLDAQKELLFQKSREELLLAKIDNLQHSINNGNDSSYYNNGDNHNHSNNSNGGGQMVQVLSQQLQDRDRSLGECENRINELDDQLRESEAKRASKDVEIAALGAQLKGLRARLDTFDAERSSSQAQQSLVADVHDRLLSAVVDIQKGANSDSLAKCINDVSTKLDRLEGLEQQLRQKEDMLALADDEVARSHAMQQQLKDALAAFSPLFLQLPKSADALERLVIERDELLAEIRRASSEGRAPDLNAVEGKVELRVLQTNSTRGGTAASKQQQGYGNGVNVNASGMPSVPPLPPLLDIRAEAGGNNRNNNYDDDDENDSSSRNNNNNNNNHKGPRVDAIPLTHLTPNDISATFRLFAPQKVSSEFRLGGDQLGLCFAALGVPMPRSYKRSNNDQNNSNQANDSTTSSSKQQDDPSKISMTEAELIAYIVNQQYQ